jgi:hypothetical protein
MTVTFDGPNRCIILGAVTTQSLRGIYSRWIDWVASSDYLKFLPAFPGAGVIADPPKVPVYLTLSNGWKIRPFAGSYTLRLTDGFLYTDDASDPFCPSGGIEPRIVYENPVIAVGYETGGGGGGNPWATILEGDKSAGDLMRLYAALLLGKSSGQPGAPIFLDTTGTMERIKMIVDANGNRTSVELDAKP